MTNNQLLLEFKQRLNKLASSDYTNLECWQEFALLNKAQIQWSRRQLHGGNQYQEGDEESKRRIDDLNILLVEEELKAENKKIYFETELIPSNYFEFKKVVLQISKKGCDQVKRVVPQLVSEQDVDELLTDNLKQPSFIWGETFVTLFGNKLRVWTNGDFLVDKCEIVYYRFPKTISSTSCLSINGNSQSEQEIEFKDDIAYLIIDEATSIAAADIMDVSNYQRLSTEVEKNN
jgi:hypothetical protein